MDYFLLKINTGLIVILTIATFVKRKEYWLAVPALRG